MSLSPGRSSHSLQVIIHGKAYDVTEFLPKHPGILASVESSTNTDRRTGDYPCTLS